MIHVFIINTITADAEFGKSLREHLEERNDIRYLAFNTASVGMEEEIAARIISFFEGEKIRFYCCGGSGTMRNIMQGTGNYKNVELAFYPLGKTNDFLKVFNDDVDKFKDIDNLIDGHVEKIDYIKTNYGYALNSVSFGIDSILSQTLEEVQEYDIFGRRVPFFLAYFRAVINAKPRKVHYQIDGNDATVNLTEMVIGNGKVFGGRLKITDDENITDGLLDYVISVDSYEAKVTKQIKHMMKGEIEELRKNTINGKCSKFVLKSADGAKLSLNLDGEIIHGGSEWEIEVVNQGMNFVVPKGVTLH